MERPLDKCIDEIFNSPGVTGVLFTNSKGLCLGAKGFLNEKAAGAFDLIAQQASSLEPRSIPIVRLETENCDILIDRKDDLTIAVSKIRTTVENGH